MLAVKEITESITKMLALRAVKSVQDFDAALDSTKPNASGGGAATLCPYFYQKAILTTEGVPADILASMSERFLHHYEQILKITCNAGGFSNPVSKLIFNMRFSSGFSKALLDTRRLFDKIWDSARGSSDFFEVLAFGAIHYCEQGTGAVLDSDRTLGAVRTHLLCTFQEVHAVILGLDVPKPKPSDSHSSKVDGSAKPEVTEGPAGKDTCPPMLDATADQALSVNSQPQATDDRRKKEIERLAALRCRMDAEAKRYGE